MRSIAYGISLITPLPDYPTASRGYSTTRLLDYLTTRLLDYPTT